MIQMLNMLKHYDFRELRYHSVEAVHLLAEVMRRAYADRAAYLGDPDFTSIPIFRLTSARYARRRARSIKPHRATLSQDLTSQGQVWRESQDTTHFSVIDRFGNAVSNTTTLNTGFGSGVTIAGWGFLMNNEMNDFNLSADHPDTYGLISANPNAIAPNKRMLSSMVPTIVLKESQPVLVLGSPGGGRIITSVLQVLLHVVDHGMRIDNAVQAPRFHHQWMPDRLVLEEELHIDLAHGLEQLGHQIRTTRAIGCVQAIAVDPDSNRYLGAADQRRHGSAAVGYNPKDDERFQIKN